MVRAARVGGSPTLKLIAAMTADIPVSSDRDRRLCSGAGSPGVGDVRLLKGLATVPVDRKTVLDTEQLVAGFR